MKGTKARQRRSQLMHRRRYADFLRLFFLFHFQFSIKFRACSRRFEAHCAHSRSGAHTFVLHGESLDSFFRAAISARVCGVNRSSFHVARSSLFKRIDDFFPLGTIPRFVLQVNSFTSAIVCTCELKRAPHEIHSSLPRTTNSIILSFNTNHRFAINEIRQCGDCGDSMFAIFLRFNYCAYVSHVNAMNTIDHHRVHSSFAESPIGNRSLLVID